jgi:outer membrane protein OmpA-like peptidoglycan-associated protein
MAINFSNLPRLYEERRIHLANRSRTMSSLLKISRSALLSITVGGLMLSAIGLAVAQDQPSAQKIMQALTPKPITRGLTLSPTDTTKAAEETKFIDTLRNRKTRSLSTNEKETIATIAKDKPSIDLEIRFDYNSATISTTSQPGVKALGEALASPELKNNTFIIAGHTDAKGGDEYNQGLSERRADSIKRYLVDKGIPAANLVTVGYGETQLKDKEHPLAAENRRVQVVNMVKSAEAKN